MTDSTRNLLARAHGQWRADRFQPETSAHVYRLDTHRVQPMPADVSDTTRRYPRTLHGVDAAFPNDPEYAADPFLQFEAAMDWIDGKWPLVFALAVAIGALLGYLAVARWA